MLNVKWGVFFLYLSSYSIAFQAMAVTEYQTKSIHQVYYLNIARSDAASALNLLARQTDSVLIYPYEVAKTKQTSAIYGYFTLYEAIDYLLVNSGLKATIREKGSILISEIANNQTQCAINTEQQVEANNTTEIIVVDGIRRGSLSAQDIKKQSVSILEALVADDLLKLPDHNAAESIAHLTGVQVSRSNDEVNGIAIRGLPYYTTTYNNREIFTAESRYFTMQDFPTTALAGMEVHKSGTAELIDPGLAGLVNLRTLKPFDLKGEKISGSFHYSYNDQSNKSSPDGNILYSNRWKTDLGNMGFLANFSHVQSEYYNSTRYNSSTYATIQSPDNHADTLIFPDTVGLYYKGAKRWRPSANIAMQWQPFETLEIYYDGLFLGYRGEKYEHNFINQLTIVDNEYGAPILDNIVIAEQGSNTQVAQLSKSAGRPPWMFSVASESKTNTVQHAIGSTWHKNNLEMSSEVAFSASFYDEYRWSVDSAINEPSPVDVDFFGDNGVTFNLPELDVFNANQYMFRGYYEAKYEALGQGVQWRTDAKYTADLNALTLIKFGFRYSQRTSELQDGWRYAWLLDLHKPMSEIDFLTLKSTGNPLRSNQQTFNQFLAPTRNSIVNNHEQLAQQAYYSLLELAERGEDWSWAANDAQYWQDKEVATDPATKFSADEEIYALYLQGHFSFEIGSADIDTIAGLRLVQTVSQNTGVSTIIEAGNSVEAITTSSNRYVDIMPSIITRVGLSEELQLRMSYTQTSTRPAFNDLNPALNITRVMSGNIGSDLQHIDAYGTSGNADLTAFTSDNYDLNLDYYFTESSLISGAVFYRDLFGLINTRVQLIDDPAYGIIELTRPENLGDGKIYGAEFNAQTFFHFLPSFWQNFGVTFNSTYLEGKARQFAEAGNESRLLAIPNLSKWTYNAAIIFESTSLSARLSYNYRSPRINSYSQLSESNNLMINKTRARDWLNLSINYKIHKNYTLYADLKNILAKPFQNYNQVSDGIYYSVDARDEGRYFGIGMRFSY